MSIRLDSATAQGKSCTINELAYSNVKCTVYLEEDNINSTIVYLKYYARATIENVSSTAVIKTITRLAGNFTWVSGINIGISSASCPISQLTNLSITMGDSFTFQNTGTLATIHKTGTAQSFVFNLTMPGVCGAQSLISNRTFTIPARPPFIDCQHDSTNLTNSFVIGKTSSNDDLGQFVIASNLNFEDDIFFDIGAEDMDLYNRIINCGWTDVFVDADGNALV